MEVIQRLALGAVAAFALELMVRKITEPRRGDPLEVEDQHSAFRDKAKLVEVRPGRELRVLVEEPQASSASKESSKTLILVHGSCARMAQYYPIMEKFKQKGYRMVAYDCYGCGGSPVPRSWAAYSTDNHVEDLNAIVDKYAGPEGTNILIGHSWGTGLVMDQAVRTPKLVCSLVLMGGGNWASDTQAAPVHPIFYLPEFLLNYLQPTLTKEFNKMALDPSTDPALVALSTKMSNANPMFMCKAFYRQRKVVSKATLAKVQQPAMVIHGANDGIVPVEGPQGAQALNDALKGSFNVIPNASHQMMMEQPDQVANLVIRFVEKLN